MRINDKGLQLIKDSEGLQLHAYRDTGGILTIGYGHTEGVYQGMHITGSAAEDFLRKDVGDAEAAVNEYVKVPLTENQFSALVSLVFNIGIGAFRKSTLLHKLNQRQYLSAARQFLRWVYDNGKRLKGLEIRRAKEKELFETP